MNEIESPHSRKHSSLGPEYLIVYDSDEENKVGVYVDRDLLGRTGEKLILSAGVYEVSLSETGEPYKIVDLSKTTPKKPKVVRF